MVKATPTDTNATSNPLGVMTPGDPAGPLLMSGWAACSRALRKVRHIQYINAHSSIPR